MNPDKAGLLDPKAVVALAQQFGTPLYVYDERTIRAKCRTILGMPNAFGLHAGFAMKANSGRAVLQIVASEGLGIDSSSLNEVRRAVRAGIAPRHIMLTSQDIPLGEDRTDLERLIADGMMYNVCSLRQLQLIADFAKQCGRALSMRVNPGVGTGETVTRNTGDKYSSFGIHLANLDQLLTFAREHGVRINQVHTHIGSGGDPEVWRENIDRVLEIVERYFPDATSVNLGGGFKEARMPDETAADIEDLGRSAKARFEALARRTGRKLRMIVEPGTLIVANSGHVVAEVIDKKSSGQDGFDFLVLDAGMETCTRPLLYGSRHPFYVVSRQGQQRSSEFSASIAQHDERVVVGRCCESGDCQTLDDHGKVVPRRIANPEIGDYVVIGGAGAYCSSMSLVGYNSYCQAAEVLVRESGAFQLTRARQSLEQLTENELSL
jgi:diaminopimelate decarboxylase